MITEFVQLWDRNKSTLEATFSERHPANYRDIVVAVVELLSDASPAPDPERVHEIDDGEYQGTLVYVIAEKDYQPSTYWYVLVDYGSCSGCDTLESIRDYADDSDVPTVSQVADYMTLALHILQGLHPMREDVAVG